MTQQLSSECEPLALRVATSRLEISGGLAHLNNLKRALHSIRYTIRLTLRGLGQYIRSVRQSDSPWDGFRRGTVQVSRDICAAAITDEITAGRLWTAV